MRPDMLYNITFRKNDTDTILYPSIPRSAADDEDKTIKRVCFADSIVNCIRAIGPSFRDMRTGSTIVVRSVPTSQLLADYLIHPSRLVREGLVPDALETQEFWYLQPVAVNRTEYLVRDFDMEHAINWKCISLEQMYDLSRKYASECVWHGARTPEEIYRRVTGMLERFGLYNESDDYYEDIVELPWAQGWNIPMLELEELKCA